MGNIKSTITLGGLPGNFSDEICLFDELAGKEFGCMPTYDYREDETKPELRFITEIFVNG